MIVDLLINVGWVMLPLAFCFIMAVAIIIERIFFFRDMSSLGKIDKILRLIQKGRINEAINITKDAKTASLRVLSAGIVQRLNATKAMEVVAIKEISAMKRVLSALDMIIMLSPLLGLLGTIIGMINSFQVMPVGGIGEPRAVTGGVAEALIATAIGITVAVIALIPYNYFLARIERETEMIEHYAPRLEVELEILPRSETCENSKKYA